MIIELAVLFVNTPGPSAHACSHATRGRVGLASPHRTATHSQRHAHRHAHRHPWQQQRSDDASASFTTSLRFGPAALGASPVALALALAFACPSYIAHPRPLARSPAHPSTPSPPAAPPTFAPITPQATAPPALDQTARAPSSAAL